MAPSVFMALIKPILFIYHILVVLFIGLPWITY